MAQVLFRNGVVQSPDSVPGSGKFYEKDFVNPVDAFTKTC